MSNGEVIGTVGFSVNGKWLTDFLRNRFLHEDVDFEWFVQTVKELLKPNGLSEERIEQISIDIILGRSYFKGSTADGTFTYCDGSDDPIKPDFFKKFSNLRKSLAEEEKARKEAVEAWQELALVLKGEVSRSNCECQSNIDLLKPSPTEELIERMIAPEKEVAPYGFISPDGEFYPVEWSCHEKFASEFIDAKNWREDYALNGVSIYNTDYLVHNKGWLLLHNPRLGNPILTQGDKRMTKAQRETLYDYFIKYGMKNEANELYGKD